MNLRSSEKSTEKAQEKVQRRPWSLENTRHIHPMCRKSNDGAKDFVDKRRRHGEVEKKEKLGFLSPGSRGWVNMNSQRGSTR